MAAIDKIYIFVIVTLPFVITWLYYWSSDGLTPPIVLEEVYYIPLFLGIFRFGFKGALWAYGVVSVAYLPFFFGAWVSSPLAFLDRLLHLLFSGIFALLAGFLIDRERRHRRESEKNRYLAGLGQAATTIVHDLKNPLIAILAFARRIREGKGDVDQAAHAIWDSAQNMQKIVESTLDFARPVQLDVKEEDLAGILNNVVDACKPKAEESGVSLTLEVPPEPLTVAVDGHTMARALANLVSNAVEASRAGQRVVISAKRGEKNHLISVSDEGMGMDREALENVFVPFYTKKSKGTGLGMVIVKKIVEAHSGKISIDSRVGHGTQVTVELPARP